MYSLVARSHSRVMVEGLSVKRQEKNVRKQERMRGERKTKMRKEASAEKHPSTTCSSSRAASAHVLGEMSNQAAQRNDQREIEHVCGD